jgi:8-oxo-dGTP diphosphatase
MAPAPDGGPKLTVDVIIEMEPRKVVLVRRRYPPPGWALPGGFVDRGESAEMAAAREAREETGLEVRDLRQFRLYSDPERDPRGHTASMVFTARAAGEPVGGDDAAEARVFPIDALPDEIAFDHRAVIADYAASSGGSRESE